MLQRSRREMHMSKDMSVLDWSKDNHSPEKKESSNSDKQAKKSTEVESEVTSEPNEQMNK